MTYEANDRVVGGLGQHTTVGEAIANLHGRQRRVVRHVNGVEQATPAHLAHQRRPESLHRLSEELPHGKRLPIVPRY